MKKKKKINKDIIIWEKKKEYDMAFVGDICVGSIWYFGKKGKNKYFTVVIYNRNGKEQRKHFA